MCATAPNTCCSRASVKTCVHMCGRAECAGMLGGHARARGGRIVLNAGLTTPAGRAALGSLGYRRPSAQRDPSADRKWRKAGNPLRQGRQHGPQVTQPCASASFVGRTERKRERELVRDRQTYTTVHGPATAHTRAGAPRAISFHPPDGPGRSAIPIRLSNLSPDPQLGAGARSQLCVLWACPLSCCAVLNE